MGKIVSIVLSFFLLFAIGGCASLEAEREPKGQGVIVQLRNHAADPQLIAERMTGEHGRKVVMVRMLMHATYLFRLQDRMEPEAFQQYLKKLQSDPNYLYVQEDKLAKPLAR